MTPSTNASTKADERFPLNPPAHCALGPSACDGCLNRTAGLAAHMLDLSESACVMASAGFYLSWMPRGTFDRIQQLRERCIEICRANDLAELIVGLELAGYHDDDQEPLVDLRRAPLFLGTGVARKRPSASPTAQTGAILLDFPGAPVRQNVSSRRAGFFGGLPDRRQAGWATPADRRTEAPSEPLLGGSAGLLLRFAAGTVGVLFGLLLWSVWPWRLPWR